MRLLFRFRRFDVWVHFIHDCGQPIIADGPTCGAWFDLDQFIIVGQTSGSLALVDHSKQFSRFRIDKYQDVRAKGAAGQNPADLMLAFQ